MCNLVPLDHSSETKLNRNVVDLFLFEYIRIYTVFVINTFAVRDWATLYSSPFARQMLATSFFCLPLQGQMFFYATAPASVVRYALINITSVSSNTIFPRSHTNIYY